MFCILVRNTPHHFHLLMYTYQTNIFLYQNSLKKRNKEIYDLNWTEYLVLVAVNKIEEIEGLVATSDVIAELQLDRAWIYSAVNKLEEKNYLDISKSKNPWTANGLSLTVGGRIILTGAERHLKQGVSL